MEFDSREVWDTLLADQLPGKVLLIGITLIAEDDSLIEHQQFWGTVQVADSKNGIQLSLGGSRAGQDYVLPPDTRSINIASPGEYKFRSTGEIVVDPDYTVTFSVYKRV